MLLFSALLATLILVSGSLVVLTQTAWGRRQVGRQLAERAGQALGLEVEVGEVGVDLGADLIGEVKVRRVKLSDPLAGAVPLVALERLDLRIEARNLLLKQVALPMISIDGLSIALGRDENGNLALPGLAGEPEPDQAKAPGVSPWRLRIGRLELDRVRVEIAGAGGAAPVVVDSLAVTASCDLVLADPVRGTARLHRLQGVWADRGLALRETGVAAELGEVVAAEIGLIRLSLAGAPAEIRGSLGGGEAELSLHLAELAAGQLTPIDPGLASLPPLALDAEFRGRIDRLEPIGIRLDLRSLGAHATISGTVTPDPAAPRGQLRFAVTGLNPVLFHPGAPAGDLALEGEVDFVGAPERQAEFDLTIAPGTLAGVDLAGGRIAATMLGDLVVVDSLRVTARETEIRASGRRHADGALEASLDLAAANLSQWQELLGLELTGDLAVELAVTGPPNAIAADASFDARRVAVSGKGVASGLSGTARLTISGTSSGTSLAGPVELRADSIRVGDGIRLAGLRAAADLTPGPAVSLDLSVAESHLAAIAGGPFPLRLVAEGGSRGADGFEARVTRFSLGDLLVLGDPLLVAMREQRVMVEGLDLRIAGGAIQGSGSRSADEIRANVALSELDLAALIGLLPEPGPATGISGLLSAESTIEDQGKGAQGEVSLELSDLVLPEVGVPLAAAISATVAAGRLAARIRLRAAGTDSLYLDLDGPLGLGLVEPGAVLADGPFSLTLAAASDSLRPYLAAAMGRAEQEEEVDSSGGAGVPAGRRTPLTTLGASGLVLRVEGEGRLGDPAVALDLRLTLPPEPELGTPILFLEGALARDLLELQALLRINETEVLRASTRTPVLLDILAREVELPRADSLSGTIWSRGLDLGRLAQPHLGEETILTGLLDLEGDLSGTVENPRIRGEIALRDAAVEHRPLGLEFKEIQLTADFTERHLVLKSATGRTRRGRLELSGGLPTPLAPEDPVELNVKATGLSLRTPEGVRAGADLELTVGGTILHPSIIGKVLVEEATIPIPERRERPIIQLSEEDERPGGAMPAAQGARGAGSQMPLDLDVTVEIPRNFWIKNRQINVEIGGELDLASRSDGLRLTGTLNTIQGRIKVAGKTFTVERGEITFFGDLELNPELQIDAVTMVDDVTIRVLLRGSAREPEIEIASEPQLPEADIFSLLLFGKRTDQLTEGEQTSLTTKARGLAASAATRELQQALATQLRLDVLEIESGETERVTVGKYVNPRTMVRYQQDLSTGGVGGLTIEYWLTPRFEIEVTGDQRGETALDFLWRIE